MSLLVCASGLSPASHKFYDAMIVDLKAAAPTATETKELRRDLRQLGIAEWGIEDGPIRVEQCRVDPSVSVGCIANAGNPVAQELIRELRLLREERYRLARNARILLAELSSGENLLHVSGELDFHRARRARGLAKLPSIHVGIARRRRWPLAAC